MTTATDDNDNEFESVHQFKVAARPDVDAQARAALKEKETIREAFRNQSERIENRINDQTEYQIAEALEAEKAAQKEVLESIEVLVTDPNGNELKVEMGRPSTVSYLLMDKLFPGKQPSQSKTGLTRIMLHVRKINGQAAPPINRELDVDRMLERFGDNAIEELALVYADYFSSRTELRVLKKKSANKIVTG